LDIDRHVGRRIRERRIMLGMPQQDLARLLGVSYQQVHKYERGINRISVGALYQIAQALGAGIEDFFEGYGDDVLGDVDPGRRDLMVDFSRSVLRIEREEHRTALHRLTKALADAE
jgi:transcriptional regulator with XRE-family HTH domain